VKLRPYSVFVTVFDLLFLACAVMAVVTLIVAAVTRSLTTLGKLGASIGAYLVMVYTATLFSKPVIAHTGEPQCSDDWCIEVDGVERTPAACEITLRIFSRAKGRAQREAAATDVYLVDDQWNRFDPTPNAGDVPLNVWLQPGESVTTKRRFNLPAGSRIRGLRVGRSATPAGPLCLVIGECEAFHKGRLIALDQ